MHGLALWHRVCGWLPWVRHAGGDVLSAKELRLQAQHDRSTIELLQQLRERDERIGALRTQADALRARIRELEDQAVQRQGVRIERNAVWIGAGEAQQGPFCQTCYATTPDHRLVPMNVIPTSPSQRPRAQCGGCKNVVYLVSPDDPPPPDDTTPRRRGPSAGSWVHGWRGRW